MRLAMITCLVRLKYPDENKLQSINPYEDHYLKRKEFELIDAEINDYERQLKELDFATLKDRFEQSLKNVSLKQRAWAEKHLENSVFTGSAVEIDYAYWLKHPSWEIDQAVALSLGCDPDAVNITVVKQKRPQTAFAKAYQRRYLLWTRIFEREPYDGQIKPVQFLQWAAETDELVDATLIEHLKDRFSDAVGDLSEADKKSNLLAKLRAVEAERDRAERQLSEYKQGIGLDTMNPRRRRTYLSIIIALLEKQGHDRKWVETSTATILRRALGTTGSRLKDETIDDFLKELRPFLVKEHERQSAATGEASGTA